MAKKPLSTKNDPASLAFSAVENALKDSILEPDNKGKATPIGATKSPRTKPTSRAQTKAANRIAAKTGNVANDDKFSPSKLLYGLNAKPSATPIWIAAVLSLIWLAITGFSAYSRFAPSLQEGTNTNTIVGSMDFTGIIATMFLPVLGFFAVAILARRAQELRIAATSMTQAAVHLAEPETTAADKVATVGQAVRREVTALADGLERALSRAGELEVMIHNEVTVLDKTYSENESRMRGLIQELASQRDSVITNSERVREAISESHSGLVFDLDMIAQRIAGTIEERGGELTSSMNKASDDLHSAFGEKSSSFISLVDNRTTDLLASLDDSAGRLNLTLEDRTANISGAFEERTHELASVIDLRMNAITEALDTRAVSLSDSIDERTASISSVLRDGGGKILADLRDRGHEVGGALDAIGLRIANEISGRVGEAEVTMNKLTGQMDEMVSTQINSMESRMQSTILELSGAIDESTDQARDAFLGAGSNTLSQFDARVEEVAVVLDTRLKSFDEVIGEKGERLTTALDSYTTSFASRANVLELALDEKTGHFNDQISQRTREMSETISGRAKQITDTIETRSTELNDSLDAQRAELNATLDGNSSEVAGVMAARTQNLAETLTNITNDISTSIGSRTQELATTLNSATTNISDSIGTRTQEMAQTIDQHGTNARDKIDASLQAVTETMDTRSTDLTNIITAKVTQVNESLGRGIENAVGRISDAESGINARVEAAAATVNQSAALTADLIEAGVNSARTAITDMVDERLSTLPEAITTRADITADRLSALNETINTSMGKTMSDLETNASRLEDSLNSTTENTVTNLQTISGKVEETINTTMGQTVANLETSATRIEDTINTRIVKAAEGMSANVGQSADRMDSSVRAALEKITEVAGKFESLVRIDAAQSAASLGQQVESINTVLEEKTGQFASIVEQRSTELTSSLASHSNILNEALRANASEAQTIMSTTSAHMMSDVTGALEKMNESNTLLQTVLDAATNNLATLQNNVASQTAAYTSTVREALGGTEQAGQLVGEHVGALQATIRSMMEEFSSMVGKLDGETTSINTAAQNLSQASSSSLEAVEARREAMDALAVGFTSRADDIDNRLRNFAQSIADTVNETERRLAGARSAMDEALNTTSSAVTDKLETLAQTANSEGMRTSTALQSTQEAMVAEMQQALADATRRFNETAQAMQDTARQVGTELESTRSELQRGFLELPEETKASAAAMRSVVAEQIEALSELNSIVHSQPSSHDVSRASLSRPAPIAAPTPAPVAAPTPIPTPAPVAPPARAPLTPPAPVAAPVHQPSTSDSILDTLTRPAPAPVAPTTPIAPAREEPKSQGNGWLRDVLRNASASQQASTTPPQSNALASLSNEMAKSIDENALADAWQRYQAGETGVFSRRIYTLTGQGTYDEVRKKLQRDPTFAQTTQEYVAEFEQLLQTASNSAEARQILISDRGKVFTMLAHASGRIG